MFLKAIRISSLDFFFLFLRGTNCINVKEKVLKNHKYAFRGQQESSKNRQWHDPEILPTMKFCQKLGSNTGSNTFFLQKNFF